METHEAPFVASINSGWRQRAFIRSTVSAILALLSGFYYSSSGGALSLALAVIFGIFAVVPLVFVGLCNPPLIINDDHIILRAIRQRRISFDDIDQVLFDEEAKLLGVKLRSGNVSTVPWHLLDDPVRAHRTMLKKITTADT